MNYSGITSSRPNSPRLLIKELSFSASTAAGLIISNIPLLYVDRNHSANSTKIEPEEEVLGSLSVVQSSLTNFRYLADRIMTQTGVRISVNPISKKPTLPTSQSKFLEHIQKATMKNNHAPFASEYKNLNIGTDQALLVTIASEDKAALHQAFHALLSCKDAHQYFQRIEIPLALCKDEAAFESLKEKLEEIFNRLGGLLFEWISEKVPYSDFDLFYCNLIGCYENVMSARVDAAALFDSLLLTNLSVKPAYVVLDLPLRNLVLFAKPAYRGLYDKEIIGNLHERDVHFYLPPSWHFAVDDALVTKKISIMTSDSEESVLAIHCNILSGLDSLSKNARIVDLNANSLSHHNAAFSRGQSIYKRSLVFAAEKALWLVHRRTNSFEQILFEEGIFAELTHNDQAHWIMSVSLYSMSVERIFKCERRILGLLENIQSASVHLAPHCLDSILGSDDWLSKLQDLSADYDLQIQGQGGVIHFSGYIDNLQKALSTLFMSMVTTDSICIPISQAIKNIYFCLEYSRDIREFISGKKDGKLNKIIRDYGVNVYIEDAHDWSIVVFIEFFENFEKRQYGCLDQLLQAVESLQGELPAEMSFYIPEVHHKRIIGHGGKNIQRIMKSFGVYVKFVNALEQSKHDVSTPFSGIGYQSIAYSRGGLHSGGYHSGPSSPVSSFRRIPHFASIDNDIADNVLVKTPAKNKEALYHMKAALLEISSHVDLSVKTEQFHLPPWLCQDIDIPDLLLEMGRGPLDVFKLDQSHTELGIFKYPSYWFSSYLLIVERVSRFPTIHRAIWRILTEKYGIPEIQSPSVSPRLYALHPFMKGMEVSFPSGKPESAAASIRSNSDINNTEDSKKHLRTPRTRRSHSLIEDHNVFRHFNSILLGHPAAPHSALTSPTEASSSDSLAGPRPKSLQLQSTGSRAVGDRSALTPLSMPAPKRPDIAPFVSATATSFEQQLAVFEQEMTQLAIDPQAKASEVFPGATGDKIPFSAGDSEKQQTGGLVPPSAQPNINRFQSELIITSVAQWKTPIIAEQSL